MLENREGKLVQVDENGKEKPMLKEDVERTLDIDVSGLPSNSFKNRAKQANKTTAPAAKKKTDLKGKTKKRSFGSRFKEAFFGEDVGNVSSYVLYQVVIPYIKKLLADSASSAINLALFGDARPRSYSGDPGRTHASMAGVYNERASQNRNRGSAIRSRIRDVIFLDEEAAQVALDNLVEHIQDYGDVSLQDFFADAGAPIMNTDCKWGWTNLSNARIVEIYGEGWVLELPPVRPLD